MPVWIKPVLGMLAAFLLLPAVVSAEGRIFMTNGVALGGTDPVAYFVAGKPVQGSANYTHEWRGAQWHFASAEHRDMFAGNPEVYAPQYGGWCAWAAARNYAAATIPEAWSIVGGKLYLNASMRVKRRWERDTEGNIRDADANWPNIF